MTEGSLPFDAVLFDLGGVLADLGDPVRAMRLDISNEEFWRIWLNSSAVKDFETGRISLDQFACRIAGEYGFTDEADFESRLRSWKLRLFRGAEDLVADVGSNVELALLSNTNILHWEQVSNSTATFEQFSHLCLSFETGFYKPDIESFNFAVEKLGCEAERVLFLDDSEKNVRAASSVGIAARRVSGIDEVRQALKR